MKTRFLIFTFFATFNWVYSQLYDINWVISDEKGIDLSGPGVTYNSLGSGIPGPYHIVFEDFLPLSNNESHDWFIVFSDGTYINTAGGQGSQSGMGLGYSAYSSNMSYYEYRPVKMPAFVYLTSKYEEGDVIGDIVVGKGPGTGNSSLDLNTFFSKQTGPGTTEEIFMNHDLVAGKDVTFIVDPTQLEDCKSIILSMDSPVDIQLIPENFPKENSNFNINNCSTPSSHYSSNCLIESAYGELCISPSYGPLSITSPISVDTKDGNVFLNYRLNEISIDEDQELPFDVTFNLSGCNVTKSLTLSVSENNFHDPNYVELLCVWKANGQKYAKYHVVCYNDGAGDVGDLKMAFGLPHEAMPTTVQLFDWSARGKTGCGLKNKNFELVSAPNSSIVEVRFPRGLSGYGNGSKKECFTAWFEFVVELLPSANMYLDSLRLILPHTTFKKGSDSSIYYINSFIDHDTCFNKQMLSSNIDPNYPLDSMVPKLPYNDSLACFTVRKVSPISCIVPCRRKTFFEKIRDFIRHISCILYG